MFPNHVAKIDSHHGLNLFGLGRGYELIADCKKSVSYDKKIYQLSPIELMSKWYRVVGQAVWKHCILTTILQ